MRLFKSIFHQECRQKNYALGHWPIKGGRGTGKITIFINNQFGILLDRGGGQRFMSLSILFYFDGIPNVTLLLLSVHRYEEILSCAKTLSIRYFLRLNLVVILKS